LILKSDGPLLGFTLISPEIDFLIIFENFSSSLVGIFGFGFLGFLGFLVWGDWGDRGDWDPIQDFDLGLGFEGSEGGVGGWLKWYRELFVWEWGASGVKGDGIDG
jgi:hypothetical protein